nr:hypothetical protein [Cytophagales bacterium]
MSGKWFALGCIILFVVGCKATLRPNANGSSCICALAEDFSRAFALRADDAAAGTEFMRQTEGLAFSERQSAAQREVFAGNVPLAFRTPAILILVNKLGDTLLLPVAKDYLAIGSDSDFVRMPLSLPSTKAIAARLGFLIPTPTLVDLIYEQAGIQLKPQPMHPDERMRSNGYYLRHNELINEQAGLTVFPVILVAGHKKDVVISTRMHSQPQKVPIYGWHLGPNQPIQPLSLVHGENYEDYSHGLRLISSSACLNGIRQSLEDLFADPQWAGILGRESGISPRLLLGN